MTGAADVVAMLERAQEGSRELDGEIYKSIHPEIGENDWHSFNGVWHSRDPHDSIAFDIPPDYTTSLDAALTLVPEGWRVYAMQQEYLTVNSQWFAGLDNLTEHYKYGSMMGKAPTPALALCIAALKARS